MDKCHPLRICSEYCDMNGAKQKVQPPRNNLWIAAAFDRTVTARTTLANLGDYNPNGQEIPSLELIARFRHPSSQAPRFWIYQKK